MRELKNKLTSSKNTKKIQTRRGKSFGYQVLGFGAGGPSGPPFMEANGGSVTTDGNFKIHTFNTGGSFVVNALGTDSTYGKAVNVVSVAGGGGGGGQHGGGGGAGGMVDMTNNLLTVSATNFTVNIGSGGASGGSGGTGGLGRS